MDLSKITTALQNNRFTVQCFKTAAEAVAYLDSKIDGKRVGFGDSVTLTTLGLHDKLATHNEVYNPARADKSLGRPEFLRVAKASIDTDIFVTSANAVTETGQIVNMDGTGNRVAGSLFLHEQIYFVIGTNKIVPDVDAALARIESIAAPRNAHRKGKKTPCAVKGEQCYHCSSPERICNALVIQRKAMTGQPAEVIIIEEELGL